MNGEPEFPEVAAIPHEVTEDSLPPRPTLWGVVGYWPQGKWWKIPRSTQWHYSRRHAEIEIKGLEKVGWRGLSIVEIPGEESDK